MNTGIIDQVEKQLSKLMEYYQKGRSSDARELAKSITQKFPENEIGWKVLSDLLRKDGKFNDALAAAKKSIKLSPQDAEAHYSLGLIQQEIGILEEAEKSYIQAIELNPNSAKANHNLALTVQKLGRLDEAKAIFIKTILLKPDLYQAHNNLGNTLKKMGRLTEAEKSYKNAIEVNQDYAIAHNNLGLLQKKLKKFDEAKESFTKAIALKPNFAQAHNNLGNLLKNKGKLIDAMTSLKRAIELKPDYSEALYNLSVVQSHADALDEEIHTLRNLLSLKSENFNLRAGVLLGICKFLEGNFRESKKYLLDTIKIQEKQSLGLRNEQIYHQYLLKILKWHEDDKYDYTPGKNDRKLHVIGESHSLTSHQLYVKSPTLNFFCKSHLIKGCMQWHLGSPERNQYKSQFESIFSYLPKASNILLTIGEIDCRLDSGIIKHSKQVPRHDTYTLIKNTVKSYLNYVLEVNMEYKHTIFIQGVPCPNIYTGKTSRKTTDELIKIINMFNSELKSMSKEKELGFLDVHKLTDRGDGLSNGIWHIDGTHLSPEGVLEAWRLHLYY